MAAVAQVHGARELRKALKDAGEDLTDLKAVNKRVGDLVVAAARTRTPVRTGRLAGSLRAAAAAGKVTVRAGSATVRYANQIHFGWPARNIRARPFITEAAQSTEDVWVGFYFDEVQALVNRVGSST